MSDQVVASTADLVESRMRLLRTGGREAARARSRHGCVEVRALLSWRARSQARPLTAGGETPTPHVFVPLGSLWRRRRAAALAKWPATCPSGGLTSAGGLFSYSRMRTKSTRQVGGLHESHSAVVQARRLPGSRQQDATIRCLNLDTTQHAWLTVGRAIGVWQMKVIR
jgi:hypothetical protein